MIEWKEFKLKDVTLKIGSGATPRGGSNVYKKKGISLIRSQNVLDFRFSEEGLAFIDEEQAKDLSNVTVQENDILLNITGDSVARCCLVPTSRLPARVNQHVSIIRPNPNIAFYDFVFYYLQFIKPELLINAEIGATRNAITKGMIEEIEIFLPSLSEQNVISSILRSLDDKIGLLQHQNVSLEGMAETLFMQWFVEESKVEWPVTTFDQHVEVFRGLSYKGSGLSVSGVGLPMHNLNSVFEGGGYKFEGIKYYTGEYKERHLVNAGDIIVTNTEQGHDLKLIGYPAIVPETFGEKGLFSQHIYKLALLKPSYLSNEFLYYLIKLPIVREQITAATNGSTVKYACH
ncbi:MAG: restriction endonuclease subunit S [Saprospiraceae bacterium]|uniref:Restriction endonuclease subunit S n=1 Tax=Candidatus Opimibacter skivensis TaxID=2982028 RepID=A0A9D7XNX8_9BACT|nr:restriction endonuclease subunit S [Candidatus Opimibacter skivensis]